MPAGVRGEPGVEKIRHYRNADGKLLVHITRSLEANASGAKRRLWPICEAGRA